MTVMQSAAHLSTCGLESDPLIVDIFTDGTLYLMCGILHWIKRHI